MTESKQYIESKYPQAEILVDNDIVTLTLRPPYKPSGVPGEAVSVVSYHDIRDFLFGEVASLVTSRDQQAVESGAPQAPGDTHPVTVLRLYFSAVPIKEYSLVIPREEQDYAHQAIHNLLRSKRREYAKRDKPSWRMLLTTPHTFDEFVEFSVNAAVKRGMGAAD